MTISMYQTSVPTFVQFLTSLSAVLDKAAAFAEARKIDQSVLLKADRDLPYGEIMDLLTLLNRGGITNVGMVTERRSGR